MQLLFITSTRIGDAVLSTGLLDHLLARHPEARVTVACGPLSAPLFEAVPRLERILVVRKRRWNLHWAKLWTQVVGRRWDLVVDLRSSLTGLLVPRRQRVTFWRGGEHIHRVVELGALLGLDPPPAPRVWTGPAQEAAAEKLVPQGGPVLAVGPAANWIGKQWPAERFAALVARLTGPGGILPGARVAVLATEKERAQAQPVLDAIPAGRAIDLVGRVGLLEAAACIGRAAFFVGNDSGLMHLAAATGTPTLGLFGPSRDEVYAPWGPQSAAVRTPESHDELMGRIGFDAPSAREHLMGSLSVEDAAAAAEALWQAVAPEAAAERHG